MEKLPAQLAEAARHVARTLAESGYRGWIVGGAVRDLALGRTPKDVDMVSAAHPDRVLELFDQTHAVGKAFGIVVVRAAGSDLELATFRTESGYSDARHPDRIQFAESPAVDACRRDFTCNAIYLDPLTGELCDPCDGLADLREGKLATVGEPQSRFAEDGLRLLRMARFAAQLGLEPAAGLVDAAAECVDTLDAVSSERVRAELEGCLGSGAADRALELLERSNLIPACLPWFAGKASAVAQARQVLAALGPSAAGPAGWATLLGEVDAESSTLVRRADALRFSKAERQALLRTSELAQNWATLSLQSTPLSERVFATRDEPWKPGWELARARCAGQPDCPASDALAAWREGLTAKQLNPKCPLGPQELERAGIARGPHWSRLMRLAQAAVIDGELTDVKQVADWLSRNADQDE